MDPRPSGAVIHQAMKSTDKGFRSRRWTEDPGPRYWWHRLSGMDFVPPICSDLSEAEWEIIRAWCEETDRSGADWGMRGAARLSLAGAGAGQPDHTHRSARDLFRLFIAPPRLHAAADERSRGLFTLDIKPELCTLTGRWLERAGLTNFVTVAEGNSLDPDSLAAVRSFLSTNRR